MYPRFMNVQIKSGMLEKTHGLRSRRRRLVNSHLGGKFWGRDLRREEQCIVGGGCAFARCRGEEGGGFIFPRRRWLWPACGGLRADALPGRWALIDDVVFPDGVGGVFGGDAPEGTGEVVEFFGEFGFVEFFEGFLHFDGEVSGFGEVIADFVDGFEECVAVFHFGIGVEFDLFFAVFLFFEIVEVGFIFFELFGDGEGFFDGRDAVVDEFEECGFVGGVNRWGGEFGHFFFGFFKACDVSSSEAHVHPFGRGLLVGVGPAA